MANNGITALIALVFCIISFKDYEINMRKSRDINTIIVTGGSGFIGFFDKKPNQKHIK